MGNGLGFLHWEVKVVGPLYMGQTQQWGRKQMGAINSPDLEVGVGW